MAIAGALSLSGYRVRLWNRTPDRLKPIMDAGGITLSGMLEVERTPVDCHHSLSDAISGCTIIMVTTTADAHVGLAEQLKSLLEPGQTVVLNPGRTGGALEVRRILGAIADEKNIAVAEAQSLVFACRAEGSRVRIIGAKSVVYVAAFPGKDTHRVLESIRPLFSCFSPAQNILQTSFENIGAIFHPAVVLLNAAAIERGALFYFYKDMTPAAANLLVALDQERITAAKAYGISATSILDWIEKAYPGTQGATLCERMQNSTAYTDIRAPAKLNSRLILEDIPTGLVPLFHLGAARGVNMPLTRSVIEMCGALLDKDFWATGRNLTTMGLADMRPQSFDRFLETGVRTSHATAY